VPDVGNGADCGESRSSFQRCWLPVSGFGVHGTVAERVNSSPNLLDVGEMGVYSSYTKNSKKIPAEVEDRLFRKLQLIDDATCDIDLRSPPSNHFEKLRGNMAGKHSIRVNKQWRLVFTWSGVRGEAQDVYLDNHDYR
jgi:proteic killer suppression protein